MFYFDGYRDILLHEVETKGDAAGLIVALMVGAVPLTLLSALVAIIIAIVSARMRAGALVLIVAVVIANTVVFGAYRLDPLLVPGWLGLPTTL